MTWHVRKVLIGPQSHALSACSLARHDTTLGVVRDNLAANKQEILVVEETMQGFREWSADDMI